MKSLKRNEFDVILPPKKKGQGGGPPPPPTDVNGVQQLPEDEEDGTSESGANSTPNAPRVVNKTGKPQKSGSQQRKGKPGSEGEGEGEGSKPSNGKPGAGEPGEGEGEGEGEGSKPTPGGEGGSKPSGGKPGAGSGKGSSKRPDDSGDIEAEVTDVQDLRRRGMGGMITPEESRALQKDLGVPYEAPPDGKEIKEKISRLQPLLDKQGGSTTVGSGKGGAIRLLPDAIAKLVNSIVDWKALLKKYIGRVVGSESEPVMPNRRFVSSGDYVYGSRKAKTKLKTCVIAVDVSGSIGHKELMVMVNEVKGMASAKRLKNFEIVYFDHGIQHVDKIADNQAASYKPAVVGGGGTSFKEPLEYMEKVYKSGNLDLAVFMTDGFADLNLPAPKFKDKFIWMILDHPSFKAPFGNKIVFVDVADGKGSLLGM
jgi:hypothetical protein